MWAAGTSRTATSLISWSASSWPSDQLLDLAPPVAGCVDKRADVSRWHLNTRTTCPCGRTRGVRQEWARPTGRVEGSDGVGRPAEVEGRVLAYVMLRARRRVRVDRGVGWGGCDAPQRCRARGPVSSSRAGRSPPAPRSPHAAPPPHRFMIHLAWSRSTTTTRSRSSLSEAAGTASTRLIWTTAGCASSQRWISTNPGPMVRSWMSTRAARRETGFRTHERPAVVPSGHLILGYGGARNLGSIVFRQAKAGGSGCGEEPPGSVPKRLSRPGTSGSARPRPVCP
jgi:hypothetical protein